MDFPDVLKKSGFSEKEVGVYLALLKVGPSVVSDIAKRAKINRSTAYVILDSLSNRELVHFTERRGVKMYQPTPPEQFAKQLEDKAKQYTELADVARELAPKIKVETSKDEPAPKVRFFEGSEGMRTVYEDALSSLETIRAYASAEQEQAVPDRYYDRLAKKNIKVRMLFPETSAAQELTKANRPQQDFSPEISVYDNKIVLMSTAEKFGLIIESKELADAMKKAFDLSWGDAKRSNPKPFFGGGSVAGSPV